jgi:hypothetical protein
MLNKKIRVFNTIEQNTQYTYTLKDFEDDVIKSKRAGATHMMISQLGKSRWKWEEDLSDPYPNWGMLNISLFKIIVPDEFKAYLPADYANRNYQLMKDYLALAKKHGLRGALRICEPYYLPEQVYREHPEWRGPRCHHPRRARGYYYSPCVDHPEILEIYRKTMAKLCEDFDIDYIYIHTNDCGGGLCWSTGLYSGANGPSACKDRSPADRITGFLDTLRQGALDADKDVYIEINSNIGIKEKEFSMDAIWPKLHDKTAVNYKTNQGVPLSSDLDADTEYTFSPIKGIPLMVNLLEKMEAAGSFSSVIASYTLYGTDYDEYFRLIEAFNNNPTCGPASRFALLKEVAGQIVGEENADQLVEVWYKLHKTLAYFRDTLVDGLSWNCVNQRWINRPFVLFPQELTEEEKGYYRPYQYQAGDEAHANDLMDTQNTCFIRGYYAVFLANKIFEKARACNNEAVCILKQIAAKSDAVLAEKLDLTADKIRLLNCFFTTNINAMKFQNIIDETDYEKVPEISAKWPQDADPHLVQFEAVTRAEIDNTYAIINLINGRENKMLILAETPALEDIFTLSPCLVEQLHRKAATMLNHQLDGKRLYVTKNC